MLHVWNIYYHLPETNQPTLDKYTIHGAYGYLQLFFFSDLCHRRIPIFLAATGGSRSNTHNVGSRLVWGFTIVSSFFYENYAESCVLMGGHSCVFFCHVFFMFVFMFSIVFPFYLYVFFLLLFFSYISIFVFLVLISC